MFTLPSPQHLLSFPALPQSHPDENLWRSVFKNVFFIFQVGILDVALCGPSIPRMMNINVEGKDIHQCSAG